MNVQTWNKSLERQTPDIENVTTAWMEGTIRSTVVVGDGRLTWREAHVCREKCTCVCLNMFNCMKVGEKNCIKCSVK